MCRPVTSASLSVIFTLTAPIVIPLYLASVLEAAWVTVPVWGPSTRLSSTAATVTVCGVAQFEEPNVNEVGKAFTWPSGVTLITTSAVGCESSTTM